MMNIDQSFEKAKKNFELSRRKFMNFLKSLLLMELPIISTLPVPYISKSCIKIKIKLNFYSHTSLWCLERFYEGL